MAKPSQDISLELAGKKKEIAVVRLTRAAKRNALSDGLIAALRDTFQNLPASVRAAVIDGEGEHFCAGLDLSELKERDAGEGMHHSRNWHVAFDAVQYGPVPVVAALHGAVVGGGLELASAAHIRVAGPGTYFGLPEGQRGLFTGGGATIRVADLIGKARMIDMMLSGRLYRGDEAVSVGLCQYMVDDPAAHALQIARKAAQNPPLSNFAICSAISHMQNMSALDAAYAEAAVAGVVNTQAAARDRLAAFAGGTADKIKPV